MYKETLGVEHVGTQKTSEGTGNDVEIENVDNFSPQEKDKESERPTKLSGKPSEDSENERTETDEKFIEFAKDRKKLYQEIGLDVLKEATYAKENASKDKENMLRYIEEYNKKIELLRAEIEQKKSNIIKRILEFRKIKELEKNLGFQKENLERSKEELVQKEELISAYGYLVEDELKMRDLMDEAQKENSLWDESKKAEMIKEEERRDVAKLAEKHGVFFVHDIVAADWKPSANNKAIDTRELDFSDQLDILHGLEPTISVSTLHKGSKQKTFGRGSWGIFLSGGRVLGGEENDAGTVAYGLKDRRVCSKKSLTTESIENAILRRDFKKFTGDPLVKDISYNELVVENPEIAGVYVKWDAEMPSLNETEKIHLENGDRIIYDRWWKTLSETMKRGLPLFILNRENNAVRMMHEIDVKNRSFRVTPEYDPRNLTDMPGIYQQHMGKEEKKEAVMRVFNKIGGLIPEDERIKYAPDGTERDSRGLYNIH